MESITHLKAPLPALKITTYNEDGKVKEIILPQQEISTQPTNRNSSTIPATSTLVSQHEEPVSEASTMVQSDISTCLRLPS